MWRRCFWIGVLLVLLGVDSFSQQDVDRPSAMDLPPGFSNPRPGGEDDALGYSYEQELLSRKIFQRTLPPLSRRERIAWSFRTAPRDSFL